MVSAWSHDTRKSSVTYIIMEFYIGLLMGLVFRVTQNVLQILPQIYIDITLTFTDLLFVHTNADI